MPVLANVTSDPVLSDLVVIGLMSCCLIQWLSVSLENNYFVKRKGKRMTGFKVDSVVSNRQTKLTHVLKLFINWSIQFSYPVT